MTVSGPPLTWHCLTDIEALGWMTAVLFLKKAWSLARDYKSVASPPLRSTSIASPVSGLKPQAACFYPKPRLDLKGSFAVKQNQSPRCLLDDDDIPGCHGLVKALSPDRVAAANTTLSEHLGNTATAPAEIQAGEAVRGHDGLGECKIPD